MISSLLVLTLAQAPDALSLTQVLRSADELFPSLAATRAEVDAAQGEQLSAQGGFEARRARLERLAAASVAPEQLGRIRSPVGVITHSREPAVLALSVLAEIVGAYEALHPHG